MSNLELHAKKEMEIAGLFKKDSDYGGMLGDAVALLYFTNPRSIPAVEGGQS